MSMFDDYSFSVKPAKRSGDNPPALPQYSGGSMTASRSFEVPCVNATEFAFRMLGRYYEPVNYEDPVLPIEFPWDSEAYTQMGRMSAIGFSINPLCEPCFNSYFPNDQWMTDPSSYEQMEVYYINPREGYEPPVVADDCKCLVRIDYATPPWACTATDLNGAILANTAIRVRRTSGYELFTVPTRSLVWSELVPVAPNPIPVDAQLKGDANATVLIPKADISIEWFNIPTRYLCQIGAHLDSFRNSVNNAPFGDFLDCESYSESSGSAFTCNESEAETLLFVDWEEIEQYRTTSFRLMDSTAVRIRLKQKRIVDGLNIVGWNHLLWDGTRANTPPWKWGRVKQVNASNMSDLFEQKSWTNLLNPTLT